MSNSDASSGTQSVSRAIQLLKMFDDDHPEWGLQALVERVGLKKSTVFRLLGTLENEGLLRRTASGNYSLGSEMIVLGGRALRSNHLREISHKYLYQLTAQSGETTTLEILRQDRSGIFSMLVIDEVLGCHLVAITQYIGSHLPVHATSTGRAVLAHSPSEDLDKLLNLPLPRLTEHTVTTPFDLKREFEQIRAQGFAVVMSELELGLMATAAPIFDHNGHVQAAVSLVGPSIRLNQDKLLAFAELVKESCDQISCEMGYRANGSAKEK